MEVGGLSSSPGRREQVNRADKEKGAGGSLGMDKDVRSRTYSLLNPPPLRAVPAASGGIDKEPDMADRRAGRIPHVPEQGGGKQPRDRNKDGRWRKKRSDAKPKKR
jgi:hypothetical protein